MSSGKDWGDVAGEDIIEIGDVDIDSAVMGGALRVGVVGLLFR